MPRSRRQPTLDTREVEALALVRSMIRSGEARKIREDAGLSLSEAAQPVKVDPVTIWRWEAGQRTPRGDDALRYLRVLQVLKKASA
jgi:DNA-binding transcriptional regulator YiaG